ncbi:MAG: peptide deformylase [Candidatus Muproteobacteria bacterium RBG_16_65_34]|uniref:Peptide deformylase n=1 Tax=Candidatus Muproteobacteria bacterium RBG_16_65_34 TaxID=1817760 RepID=A0A1F6TTZ1_9PROT|nr:MAG: peptide deformylase [Candidatus Muproteobacteria bacterium RBG_16_65_34]
MAVLEVLHYPDARLKQVSAPVTEFAADLRRLLADLEATMRAYPGCVGLAAPQVGRFQRIAIVDVSSRPGVRHNGRLVLVNPQVLERGGEVVGREGCLSVPDYTGNVARAGHIRLRAQDATGGYREYGCVDYEARAVQHELDHLDGLLFLDRLVSRRDLFRRKVYK